MKILTQDHLDQIVNVSSSEAEEIAQKIKSLFETSPANQLTGSEKHLIVREVVWHTIGFVI